MSIGNSNGSVACSDDKRSRLRRYPRRVSNFGLAYLPRNANRLLETSRGAACEPGTFCPVGSSVASACSAGTFNSAQQQATCPLCLDGSYQDQQGATACKDCPPGGYCPAGSTTLQLCPGGTFSHATGLASRLGCQPVLPGFWSPTGSAVPLACPPSGFLCPGAAADRTNTPPGSLPIQLATGGISTTRSVLKEVFTLRTTFTLEEDVSAINGEQLKEQLSRLYGVPSSDVSLSVSGGSAVVAVRFMATTAEPMATLQQNLNSTSDTELTVQLGVNATRGSDILWGTEMVNITEIVQEACAPGFWCSAGYSYACLAGTFNPSANADNANACQFCSPGKYNPTMGASSNASCLDCPPGSANPIPGGASLDACGACTAGTHTSTFGSERCETCVQGTYSKQARATNCTVCEAGHWCSATDQIPCSLNTFNVNQSSHLITDCVRCPPRTSTLDKDAAESPDDCVCGDDYYRAFVEHVQGRRGCTLHPQGGAGCCMCPVGTACPGGTSLSDLPLRRGYFRLNSGSSDVRRCPDSAANCTGRNECPWSTSGCYGGPNASEVCRPTLTGVFCRSCESDDHYYVQAAPGKPAHCLSCAGVVGRAFTTEGNMVALWIIIAIVLTLITLAVCSARGLPAWMHARRRRLQQLLVRLGRTAAREYTVLNKLKILIGFYQILTKIERVYDVYLPAEVRAMLQFFQVLISLGVEGVPLACAGAVGFHRVLLFWTIAPLIAFVIAVLVVYMHMYTPRQRRQSPPDSSHFERILPIFLRVTFLAYPMVTSIAFEAFSCHIFDEGAGSWLMVDVSVPCGTPEHAAIEQTAWIAIAIYPIGLFVVNAVLLLSARRAILTKQPTRLSRALSFVYREYKPTMFFWELMEMARRFVLVGLFVIGPYNRGSLTQIGLATLTSMVFFFIQQNAEPFKKRTDNYVALAASFSLIGTFFCCVYLKISTLTELEQINMLLSIEQHDTYVFNTLPLTVLLIMCVIGTLAVSSVLVVQHAAEDARRAMHEAHLAKARRLMAIDKRHKEIYATQLLAPKSDMDYAFHLFLSHTWDQVTRCL